MNDFLRSEVVLTGFRTSSAGLTVDQPGFFLYSPAKATLFEEPTQFLHEHFVSNAGAPSTHTWIAAAQALKTWFQWLQATNKEWTEANRQDRLDYRDGYLAGISPRTGRHYEPATIAARMRVIRQFYEFATQKLWYAGDLAWGSLEEVPVENRPIDQDALAHIRVGDRANWKDRDLPKARPKVVIHPLQVSDLRALIHQCGPRAACPCGDNRSVRDRLLVDLAWVVGLRVEEIHSLTTLQFLTFHPDRETPQLAYPLVVLGKGNKVRQAPIPGWLIEDALAYIDGERDRALKEGKFSGRNATSSLLLGGAESSRPGRPLTKRRLQQIVEEACLAIGLVKIVEFRDPETNQTHQKKRPKHSIHDLRHTAAVLLYHAERNRGNSEPWKTVQTQLGHAHLQTTIDTYLHHVEIFGEKQRFYDVRKMIGI